MSARVGKPRSPGDVKTQTRYLFSISIALLLLVLAPSPIRAGGTVVAWGQNTYGQTNVPSGLVNIQAIAAGSDDGTPSNNGFSMALKPDGTISGWGNNTYLQSIIPPVATNIVAIAAGEYHAVALRADGKVLAWGRDNFFQTNVPATLSSNVVAVAAASSAGDHSLALRSDGTVIGWGLNNFGQTNVPPSATNVVAIAAGANHSLALRADGTVLAWGLNSSGQTNVPSAATNVVAIAAGAAHSLALRTNGTVVAWGSNNWGQITVPASATNIVAIAGGDEHSMALRRDGTILVWGNTNNYSFFWPTNLSNVTGIASSARHALAIVGDGTPGITVPPRDQAIYPGATAVFTVMAAGPGNLSYQWQFNGANILGATGSILILTNVQPAKSGWYQVIVRNSFGVATASAGLTLLDGRPAIVQQPPGATTIGVNSNATWSVSATGAIPMSLQWWKDGNPLANATNFSLGITNAQTNNSGGYSLIISNAYGSVSSSTDFVSVIYFPPVITGQPPGGNVGLGNNWTMSVSETGTAPFGWQWRVNQTPIPGATNNSYTISSAQFQDAGSYDVIVTNIAGSTNSNPAVVTVGYVEGPILNSTNGHEYFIVNPETWTKAQAEAQALGGNLTTIRDAGENAWIVSHMLVNFAGSGGPNLSATPIWIGMHDPNLGDGGNPQHTADFVWADGETNTYRNWNTATGEPNNNGGFEYYGVINWQWAAGNPGTQGTWNDAGLNGTSFAGTLSGAGIGPYYGIAEVNPAAFKLGMSLNGSNAVFTVPYTLHTLILQSATDLTPPVQWTPILTNSARTTFALPMAATAGSMYFRVEVQ